MRKIFFLFLIFSAGIFAVAAEPENGRALRGSSINSVLASINGQPVTLLDVVLETAPLERELAAIHTGDRLNREIEKLRRAALEDIITRRLICREYDAEPFQIPDQMIENMLDEHAKAVGGLTRKELENQLKQSGMSVADLRKKIRERIIVNVLLIKNCDKQVVVTPK
ncbi:MAG: SurA N-terminal domain-containing protein, partial [Lentisphaeria bacterium]|nr:SurA N-terminal domain-containing protein [Lentisphaeria bacterium]